MAFSDWSTNEITNGSTLGVNVAENCPRGNINNAIRTLMAQLRAAFSTSLSTFFSGSTPLPVANGGTGAVSAAAALTALGGAASGANSDITSLTGLTTALAVARGGTGATTASAALAALGGTGVSASSFAAPGYHKLSDGFIIQWGNGSIGANTTGSITFPQAFTTIAVCVANGGTSSVGSEGGVRNYATSLTGASIVHAGSGTAFYSYIAVGK